VQAGCDVGGEAIDLVFVGVEEHLSVVHSGAATQRARHAARQPHRQVVHTQIQVERSLDGPHHVILMGVRVAEDGQDAVALDRGDVAVKAILDHVAAHRFVRGQDRRVALRVEGPG
jgi:hypothetical protein